ncbi:MAG: serpin family protein [Isosphaeraceae bacterium]|nr:serpin family protein [Isosphaeraceae bacterium]
MSRRAAFLLTLVCVTSGCLGAVTKGERMDEVVAANNQFAFDLYAQLGREPGNLFFSPYSLSTALAMTYAGARGETAAQMAKTLHAKLPPEQLDAAIHALVRRIGGEGGTRPYELAAANALWAQSGLSYQDDFLTRLERFYGAGLHQLDFHADPETARRTINAWVEEQTRDKIRELLKSGAITGDTELVLTNAIYFKGRWQDAFPKGRTEEGDFFVPKGSKTRVPLMHQLARFPYAEGSGFQALELPYVGNDLSLLVLLPKQRDGLPDLERELATASAMRPAVREVDVTLPRFKMTSGFTLNDTLSALGMPMAFTARADFSGMNGRGGLSISAVVHEAFVDVNEEGTEAAAATGVVMLRSLAVKAPRPEPVIFRADHPFLFLIRETKSGCILFLGRVNEPKG